MGDNTGKTGTGRYWKTMLILLLLTLAASPLITLMAISSDQPLVQNKATINPGDAQRLKRIFRQMEFGGYFKRPQRLAVSAADLNSLFALGTRGIKRLRGEAEVSAQHGTELRLSVHLPENPFGDYINLTLALPPQAQGLELSFLRIGRIKVGGRQALWLFEQLANYLLGRRHSELLLNSIQGFDSRGSTLLVDYQPIPDLKQQLTALLKHAALFGEQVQRPENVAAIRVYFSRLCEAVSQDDSRSLGPYLARAFELAQLRSQDSLQAAEENRAALLAVSLIFGHRHFNSVVNAVEEEELASCQRRAAKVTLQRRIDFREHFVYSAFLKLMSDRDISLAIAEFKELSDTLRGGSGFNFADLAADQAGIQFAEYATRPGDALRLQRQAQRLEAEAHFFPAMSRLAQGLSQRRFENEFGTVDSERYRQLLTEIEARIEALPLYREDAAQ